MHWYLKNLFVAGLCLACLLGVVSTGDQDNTLQQNGGLPSTLSGDDDILSELRPETADANEPLQGYVSSDTMADKGHAEHEPENVEQLSNTDPVFTDGESFVSVVPNLGSINPNGGENKRSDETRVDTQGNEGGKEKKMQPAFVCKAKVVAEGVEGAVLILNGTALLDVFKTENSATSAANVSNGSTTASNNTGPSDSDSPSTASTRKNTFAEALTNNGKSEDLSNSSCTSLNKTAGETNTSMPEEVSCIVLLLYTPWCRFTARMAPDYNALGRAFPHLGVYAVDTAHLQSSSWNSRFAVVAVPTIVLLPGNRNPIRFNYTIRSFENLRYFVQNHTGLTAAKGISPRPSDLHGPLPSIPSDGKDFYLILSWVALTFIAIHFVCQSSFGEMLVRVVGSGLQFLERNPPRHLVPGPEIHPHAE